MPIILTFLLLAADAGSPAALSQSHELESSSLEQSGDAGYAEAVEVFRCDFDEAADKNFDDWPDDWSRRSGRLYPHYLPIAIAGEGDKKFLRIGLDGGAAAVYSPHIPVSSLYSYVLTAEIQLAGLVHNVAYISLTFYDDQRDEVGTPRVTTALRTAEKWKTLELGPINPLDAAIRTAVIGLHLEPTAERDLTGSAMFSAVVLSRLPRMKLRTASEVNIFQDPGEVAVWCEISGIPESSPQMTFTLRDVRGEELAVHTQRLDAKPVNAGDSKQQAIPATDDSVPLGYMGTVQWKPPITNYGFYRVEAAMHGRGGITLKRAMNLVVLRPEGTPASGEFGWSLPQGEHPLSLAQLNQLLGKVGVNWVKFPLWYDTEDNELADRLARFIERLGTQGIRLVGVLDAPPAAYRHEFTDEQQLPIATVFNNPSIWQPRIDPVMTRLSLKVSWWQLGGDDDVSFVGMPELAQKIEDIRLHLQRFGQKIHLGVAWNWMYDSPVASSLPPWKFLSYSVEPPFTARELGDYLDQEQTAENTDRWVALNPLPAGQYSIDARACDLVARMLNGKIHGASCVFVPRPFDGDRGLMNTDGTPGELLLPWRTTAVMISGAEYLGSMTLPGGSKNHLFAREGEDAVMVIWNETPTAETLYLGDNVEHIDLWGRSLPIQSGGNQTTVQAGPLPTFVRGLNAPVARWRMGFEFPQPRLASMFGKEQTVPYSFSNPFSQGVGGRIHIHTPTTGWDADRTNEPFRIAAGESLQDSFNVVLRADANSGRQQLRIDFDLTADRHYEFSVYRNLEVGLGDVELEINSRLTADGALLVEQRITNNSDSYISFNCLLFAPGRRRQRIQVLNLGPGQNTSSFVLPEGEELIGQTLWLRAEEIEGNRVLNYRFTPQE